MIVPRSRLRETLGTLLTYAGYGPPAALASEGAAS